MKTMSKYIFVLLILPVLLLVPRIHGLCNPIGPLQHGQIDYEESYSYYKATCDPGYILHGNIYVSCVNGEWSNPPPTCLDTAEKNACEELPVPENGKKDCHVYPSSTGKMCRFTCADGYVRTGSEIRICLTNEKWSGYTTQCFPKTNPNGQQTVTQTRPNYYASHRSSDHNPSTDLDQKPCINFGCKHMCKANRGKASCLCRNGYTLDRTDGKSCIETQLQEPADYKTDSKSTSSSHPYSPVSGSQRDTYKSGNNNDACQNHQCAGFCRIENNRAQCRCERGYILNKEDQKSCDKNLGPPVHPSNPCSDNNGGCSHRCHVKKLGQVACRCPPRHTLAKDGKNCFQSVTKALPVSCNEQNGGCQHNCKQKEYGVECSCQQGYELHTNKKDCTDINECLYNNGGCQQICVNLLGSNSCSCKQGYQWDSSFTKCIESVTNAIQITCDRRNGGCQHICSPTEYGVECSCRPGYELHADKRRCSDINECSNNNGGCEQKCVNTPGSYSCACKQGYQWDSSFRKCIDIDECKSEHLNYCQHNCENTEGSYTCSCKPGYVMIENHKCEGCRKNSYWSTEKNGCVDCPANSRTRWEGRTSKSDCICFPGFIGSPKDDISCSDSDECADNNFGCSHQCFNTPGGAFCSCPLGYTIDHDNKTCIDIDECSLKNGGCEGVCVNTNGSFHCLCTEGYKKSNKNIYTCEDVDECSENNGGCQHICINYRGGYYCACKEGYRLDSSLTNCTDVSCPALPLPHFSNVKCKKEGVILAAMDNYPAGTVCTFRCFLGYKDASNSNTMECQEDATWKGSLAKCISQSCPPLKVPKNGDVHPSSCSTDGNSVKQKCTFTCRQGFNLKGTSVFNCQNNLSWKEDVTDMPVCEHDDIRASMECIRDITATLQPGKSSHNITLPEPITNMESYDIQPENIIVGKPVEFRAGKTKVIFTTRSPSSSRIAKCVTTVHVVDEEPPVFINCPDDIVINNAKVDGEVVTWEEPEVVDNVQVESVTSSVELNSTLKPGSYLVAYTAMDPAGNTESCTFNIDVVRLSCDNLTDPANGEANCMDWLYGNLCQPLCDDRYMRNPSDPLFYSCGDSGIWEPSHIISDCLPFTEAVSSTCPDGSELKIIEETEEEICLECPSKAPWSPTTRKCEE